MFRHKFVTNAGVIAAVTVTAPAAFGSDYSGAYLCVQEFGGGIHYDEQAKRWESTTFRPDGKFVIHLRKSGEIPAFEGSDVKEDIYNVTISEFGDANAQPCYGNASGGQVQAWGALLICRSLTEYRVNFENLRFLEAYPIGYLSGIENNDNTPSMMGGTCAKVE